MMVTLKIPAGLVLDDTSVKVGAGGWIDADKVRFWRGCPEVIGGWEQMQSAALTGKCRGLFSWVDDSGRFSVAMGTSEKLYVNQAGDDYDITPSSGFTEGLEDGTGGQGYGTGTYGTGLYSQPSTGDYFPLTWSKANYGQTLLANPRNQTIFQWSNDGAVPAVSLGRSTTNDDDFSGYADQTAFDAVFTSGAGWAFDGGDDQVDGTTASSNVTYTETTVSGKYYRVDVVFSGRSAGTIAAMAGGSAGTASSEAEGTVSATFKASSTSTAFGWQGVGFTGNIDSVTVYALAAPDNVTAITVPMEKRHVVAFGCNEEATDYFNPRGIRWCDFEDLSDWVTSPANNAGEYILEGSGAIVRALEVPYGTLIWTTNEIWFMSYLGAPDQTYQFTRLGTGCGLIGPNGAVVFEGTAYWMAPDFSYWACPSGGIPQRVISPVRANISGNISAVQDEKIYAASVGEFKEIWWHYPDSRDGNENSRYVSLSLVDGSWSAGQLARTAMIDAGSGPSPIAVDDSGAVFFHERGTSANGGAISWAVETGDIRMTDGNQTLMFDELRCDVKDQAGAASLTVTAKMFPQGDETVSGPHTMLAGQDRIHFRQSGRMLRLKFSGNVGPCVFRLGSVIVGLKARGSR